MPRRSALAMGLAAAAGLARRAGAATSDRARWGVDYGPATDRALARRCRLLVLEPHHERPIAPLRSPGATVLGYVSFGEVEKSRPYAAALDRAGALRAPNPHWPDARHADLRHPAWTEVLLEQAIPAILARGYDGIFIDTLDNAEAMERDDPAGARGMVAAAATLLDVVRARFPAIRIMLNRGYAVLPEAATRIDWLLAEAMASRWSFAEKRYERLSEADWQWQADRLRAAKARNPRLGLATLDYWEPSDTKQVAALYARERAAGFLPCVSTLALDRLIPEPGR